MWACVCGVRASVTVFQISLSLSQKKRDENECKNDLCGPLSSCIQYAMSLSLSARGWPLLYTVIRLKFYYWYIYVESIFSGSS